MSGDFRTDMVWQSLYIEEACNIIRANAGQLLTVGEASPDDDMHNATDLNIVVSGAGTVALRIRRDWPGDDDPWRDLTIRNWRKKGTRTEWSKIVEDGVPRWYLYIWTCGGPIVGWMLVDVDVLRPHLPEMARDLRAIQKYNTDGTTGFMCIGREALDGVGAVLCSMTHDGR